MTENTNERPWESAPIPWVQYLYYCERESWHDCPFSAYELYWYEGYEKNPAGWLCDTCQFRVREDRYGFDSQEARDASWRSNLHSLADEMVRREQQRYNQSVAPARP